MKHYEEWYDEVVDDEQYCLSSYNVAANPSNDVNYKKFSKNIATQGIIKFNLLEFKKNKIYIFLFYKNINIV